VPLWFGVLEIDFIYGSVDVWEEEIWNEETQSCEESVWFAGWKVKQEEREDYE
jgi:hypothetical protein